MPRSFIALESNEEVQASLTDIQDRLVETGADLKIVEPENIHLTLRFLGNVSNKKLELIKEVFHKTADTSPFEVSVEGMGVFPNPDFIRVVWAGVTTGASKLKHLREDLDEDLSEIDHPPDDKEFTPHFTIARMKSGKSKERVVSLVRSESDREFGTIFCDELKLKKSELTSEGPIYTDIDSVKLG